MTVVTLFSTGCATVQRAATTAAERATGREVEERVDRSIDGAAQRAEDAVLGTSGDDSAQPSAHVEGTTTAAPGMASPTGVATDQFDFEPGERSLFETNFAADRIGDFPRAMDMAEGQFGGRGA